MVGIDSFLGKFNIEKLLTRFKKEEKFFGLDIGTKSVKIVQLQEKKILHLGLEELPLSRSVDDKTISRAIKKGVGESKIKTNKVVACVSGPTINVRYIKMPKMPEEELREAIKWDAKKYITMDPEEAIIDHFVLREVVEEGLEKVEVMIAAAPKEIVQKRVSLIQGAGLVPLAIDVAPFALWRSIRIEEGEITAFIDIGAGITNIAIVEKEVLHFARGISLAGDDLTRAISKAMNLDFDQAESLKKEEGLKLGEEAPATRAMRPPLERLVVEIERSFHYFLTQAPATKIDKIILAGGSSGLKGLAGYLKDSLGISIEPYKPLDDMEINEKRFDLRQLESIAPRMAIAFGLARRE